MENALVAACLGGLLSRHNARDEVEGLNIAMKESCVLKGYELNALRKILDLCGLDCDPNVGLALFGERMVADSGTAGRLPINKVIAAVNLADHIVEDVFHLILCAGKLDAEQSRAVEETVDVLVKSEDNAVAAVSRVIDAVAEIAHSVVHRNHHFFKRTEFAVVIPQIFHLYIIPFPAKMQDIINNYSKIRIGQRHKSEPCFPAIFSIFIIHTIKYKCK